MKFGVTSKWRIWLIISLALVAIGMACLGIFGLNDAVDYTNSYEVQVGVDQDVDGLAEKAKEYAIEYFNENHKSFVCYACQETEDGDYIFKFCANPEINNETLNKSITDKLNTDKVKVETAVREVVAVHANQVVDVAITLGLSAVVAFLFILIKDKLKASLAVLGSSLLAVILTISFISFTRIPAYPFLGVSACASLLFAGILSGAMVSRFKEETKNAANAGATDSEIADIVASRSKTRFGCMLIAFLLFALVLAVINFGYLSFISLHVIIIGVCAIFSSYIFAPIIWSAVSKNKKN